MMKIIMQKTINLEIKDKEREIYRALPMIYKQ